MTSPDDHWHDDYDPGYDPAYAARILMAAAAQCARYDHAWCVVRPPLGVRRERREAA